MQSSSELPSSKNSSASASFKGAAQLRGQRQRWERVMAQIEQGRRHGSQGLQQEMDVLRRRNMSLETQVLELKDNLERREDKIRRMQQSFSWQITSPLRALRRVSGTRDAKAQAKAGNAGAQGETGPAKTDPGMLWSVDNPVRWNCAPASGVIRGWFLWMPEARPARAIRARIDDQVLEARMAVQRPDVVAAHGFDRARATECGFVIEYKLRLKAEHPIELEALSDEGRWVVFLRQTLRTSDDPQTLRGYKDWVQQFSTLTEEKRTALKARLDALPASAKPLISVLMPVYNTPSQWLQRAIESVREQVYGNWQLCIADDASSQVELRPLLEKLSGEDKRIQVVFRPENGHISRCSNSALELARGEFTALFDHDDELAPDALAEIVLHLAEHPELDLVYTDEDKIDTEGLRSDPYFKPDFLPELITGQNFCSHLSVFRTHLLKEVGGFRPGFEGSQDWDLVLRVTERCGSKRVGHIPKVLYHWRMITGSTAVGVAEKSYSVQAAKRALEDHFAREGLEVDLRMVPGCHWQVLYPLSSKPLVSIIIPTRNGVSLLRTCIASLFARTDYEHFEILVVNNGSDQAESLAFLEELRQEPRVRVLDYNAPFNYSAINNFAVEQARGELVCLLNNDIEVYSSDWLSELVSHAIRPGIGAVGAMLYYPDMTIQHAGVVLGPGGVANHAFWQLPAGAEGYINRARLTQNFSAVTGACLLIRKAIYTEVGGLNAKDLAVAFNDVDFCLKVLKAGYRNVWTPFSQLLHHESASRGLEDTPEKKERFRREVEYMRSTWGPLLDNDPAYNPNLSFENEGWGLAWPPRR